ncbi:FUSC family membrane protein [Saccharicrinis fermentans]|uniref:Inner membrane protein YccS n=1 Tax=Saccharicrinis fermentans DSM 9555 = JCM 21142 TaxID=869213 RepID=W7YLT6_9BACT|nr:FUSC family membrane protein [Saccharicrinis fermentans]GAF03344.1 inner membrane protein YccS [Saccharicrinis fermentans DSM 9555 = JCM 21142]
MVKLHIHIKHQAWFQRLVKEFWRHPNRLTATKVMITMAVQAIPFIILGNPFLVVTLSLGTVAAALSERDDHPRGRIKALAITIISFAITTLSVSLLKPYPILFGTGFIASTIVFVLIGGISERYRGISYGAILIGIYAMIGYREEYLWYEQALFLCAGALFYGLLSLYLLYRKPWRLLEEQLATGFMALSEYLKEKAKNFPSEKSEQTNHQAILNIKVVNALEKCKEVINVYGQEVKSQKQLIPYLQRFMLLQSLHERAASGHENYEKLADKEEYKELLEGFAELLHQLSHASKLVAENMLTGEPYSHPVSIGWIVNALEFEIEKVPQHHKQLLELLLHNLNRSHQSLKNIDLPDKSTSVPRLGQDERTILQRIKEQLNWSHPRLRYAIRLSACFLIGYLIIQHYKLENGEWILLTSLFVSQPTYSETRRKLLERIVGTLTGVSIGILMLQLLPTQSGQFILLLASGFSFFYWRFSNYSYAVIFISIYVLANNQLTTESGGYVLIPRVIDTLIGSLLSFLTIRFLWPNWQHKQIPKLLSKALQNNSLYFNAIINRTNLQKDDYDYRLARRLAHKADNALTLAWQSMQVEPKKRRHLIEQAFKLTYLNHALLSYLSALGALYQDHTKLALAQEINTAITLTLNRTATRLSKDESTHIDSLKPVLMNLRDMINDYSQGKERQHLRLIYNIAAVSNKLLKESASFQK